MNSNGIQLSENSSTETNWNLVGYKMPKATVVYISQVVLIYIIVVTSVVNLTLYKDNNSNLWTALLSSCIGYLLPNPSLKRYPTNGNGLPK